MNQELLNCFEEANIARAHANHPEQVAIGRALEFGLFVVVERTPAHCRSTDACCGEYVTLRATYTNREAAVACVEILAGIRGSFSDSFFDVLPAPVLHHRDSDETEGNLPF